MLPANPASSEVTVLLRLHIVDTDTGQPLQQAGVEVMHRLNQPAQTRAHTITSASDEQGNCMLNVPCRAITMRDPLGLLVRGPEMVFLDEYVLILGNTEVTLPLLRR